jgi:hypothetical protein
VTSTSPNHAVQLTVELRGKQIQVAILARNHPRSLAASLDALIRAAERTAVLAIRERAYELRPTWHVCRDKRERLLAAPGARWLDLEREDETKLLALQGLLSDARSRDLTDPAGRPFEPDRVRQWVEATLDLASWAPLSALQQAYAGDASTDAARPGASPAPARAALAPRIDDPAVTADRPAMAGVAIGILRQLRVASLDRLLREIGRAHGPHGRAAVLAQLESAGDGVQWFGRSIVAIREER